MDILCHLCTGSDRIGLFVDIKVSNGKRSKKTIELVFPRNVVFMEEIKVTRKPYKQISFARNEKHWHNANRY